MSLEIKKFLNQLNISSQRSGIYEEALTHSSFANEHRTNLSYERLEFMGDSFINYVVARTVFETHNGEPGQMTLLKNHYIQRRTIAAAARRLAVEKIIRIGKSEKAEALSDKILEDVYEALVGAILLDAGEEPARNFILGTLLKDIDKIGVSPESFKDPKTELQELIQKESRQGVTYNVTKSDGNYFAEVRSGPRLYATGYGVTQAAAKRDAAIKALDELKASKPRNKDSSK